MTPHWTWGLSTAVILTVVIWMNGRQYRLGWLLGATVQFINITYGWLVHGQWTFVFLLLPASAFVWNYWRSRPRHVKKPALLWRTGLGKIVQHPKRKLQEHAE